MAKYLDLEAAVNLSVKSTMGDKKADKPKSEGKKIEKSKEKKK